MATIVNLNATPSLRFQPDAAPTHAQVRANPTLFAVALRQVHAAYSIDAAKALSDSALEDLFRLYVVVTELGGCAAVTERCAWGAVCLACQSCPTPTATANAGLIVQGVYWTLLRHLEHHFFWRRPDPISSLSAADLPLGSLPASPHLTASEPALGAHPFGMQPSAFHSTIAAAASLTVLPKHASTPASDEGATIDTSALVAKQPPTKTRGNVPAAAPVVPAAANIWPVDPPCPASVPLLPWPLTPQHGGWANLSVDPIIACAAAALSVSPDAVAQPAPVDPPCRFTAPLLPLFSAQLRQTLAPSFGKDGLLQPAPCGNGSNDVAGCLKGYVAAAASTDHTLATRQSAFGASLTSSHAWGANLLGQQGHGAMCSSRAEMPATAAERQGRLPLQPLLQLQQAQRQALDGSTPTAPVPQHPSAKAASMQPAGNLPSYVSAASAADRRPSPLDGVADGGGRDSGVLDQFHVWGGDVAYLQAYRLGLRAEDRAE